MPYSYTGGIINHVDKLIYIYIIYIRNTYMSVCGRGGGGKVVVSIHSLIADAMLA